MSRKEDDPDYDRFYFVKLSVELRYGDILAKLKGAPLAVYIAIGLHVNRRGKAWPGTKRLSDLTGYSRRQVVRAISRLEILGLLRVERGGIDYEGKAMANLYSDLGHFCYGRGTGHADPPETAYTLAIEVPEMSQGQ